MNDEPRNVMHDRITEAIADAIYAIAPVEVPYAYIVRGVYWDTDGRVERLW